MDYQRQQPSGAAEPPGWRRVMAVAAAQHGVITRAQLLGLGLSAQAIKHRRRRGRLHPVYRGVYAVGRPQLSREGHWMAAVLACGPGAVLSHSSAAALWGIVLIEGPIEISVSLPRTVRRPGIRIHRRQALGPDLTMVHAGIPVTTPIQTLVDLATRLGSSRVEAAIIESDKRDLFDPEELRVALDRIGPVAGRGLLRRILDRRTFTLTDSQLERRFLPIARRAGLPPPETRQVVNGYRVDFYWPDLGLVVETDGLRYHRTPQQQARDTRRDQVHTAAGLTSLRFTHAQVAYESSRVETTLRETARRLKHRSPGD